MDVQRRYQIFVSSTYEDLRPERAQVAQAILELGHFPSGMELFPASNETQWEVIKKVIDESDYYVVVVAGRYGSTDGEGVAYTEKEFEYAAAKGIPILGFVRRNIENLPNKYCENSSIARASLEKFRKKVQSRASSKNRTKSWRTIFETLFFQMPIYSLISSKTMTIYLD